MLIFSWLGWDLDWYLTSSFTFHNDDYLPFLLVTIFWNHAQVCAFIAYRQPLVYKSHHLLCFGPCLKLHNGLKVCFGTQSCVHTRLLIKVTAATIMSLNTMWWNYVIKTLMWSRFQVWACFWNALERLETSVQFSWIMAWLSRWALTWIGSMCKWAEICVWGQTCFQCNLMTDDYSFINCRFI